MNQHLGPMDEFIRANTGLVHHVAKRYKPVAKVNGLEYEDIVQEGYIGLIKAYHRFDPSYEVQFATFAVPYICGAIRMILRNYGPVHVYRAEKEIAQRIRKAGLDDQSAAEISERLGCTVKQATHALLYRQHSVLSIDYPINMGKDTVDLNDMIPDHDDQTGVYVEEFIATLTVKQARVMRLRLRGNRQVDIARVIGVSQMQISKYMAKIGRQYLREVM